ncbi:hypothetical protein MRB53_010842 [Persea americana]|uniref:Uncharacterized protein n=1 Tax=Persea americana TaxID=3435 RepID=A0ACC2LTA1_PERAE|nr:hypothetical protein MRB53_010842 [Persea americana]
MYHILEELSKLCEEVVDPFDYCISSCKTAEEFEKCWKKLLIENDLEDHDWFDSLYDTRQKWVPAYLKHVFFAGISAEKQSQSMELFFEKYVSKNTTLLEFVLQFERYLAHRRHEEQKADLETQRSQPTLKTLFVLEKHIREIYTPTIFKKFQDELWKSTVYKLNCVEDNGEVRKYEVEKGDHKSKRTHVGHLEITRKKANCSCLRFEFEGIPCRHVLSVLRHAGVWYLPDHYILKRWARYPTKGFASNINGIKVLGGPSDSSKFRYNDLYCIANKCVTDGATSKRVYCVAKQWLNKCMIEVTKAKGEIK